MQFQQNERESKGIPDRVGTEAESIQCGGSTNTGLLLEPSQEIKLKVRQGLDR